MIVFPNCKINLGLNVIRKRSDGYHDVQTVYYPIGLQDALEIIEVAGSSDSPIENIPDRQVSRFHSNSHANQLSISGRNVDGKEEDNLCIKAHRLLKDDFPHLPYTRMFLHKNIPPGAGLGGGSADGAFTLKLLNQKFNLGLTTQGLLDYALALGSDCPFFIINKPCVARGRGEVLERVDISLKHYKIFIVNPGIRINTAEAFSLIRPLDRLKPVEMLIQMPIESWRGELKNDFETPIFQKYPAIEAIKAELYNAGAVYASMSGSGSTVYGLFDKEKNPSLSFPPGYFVRELGGQL